MITIVWYNVVAIIVGILWIVWLKKVGENNTFGIGSAFVILVGIAFSPFGVVYFGGDIKIF